MTRAEIAKKALRKLKQARVLVAWEYERLDDFDATEDIEDMFSELSDKIDEVIKETEQAAIIEKETEEELEDED